MVGASIANAVQAAQHSGPSVARVRRWSAISPQRVRGRLVGAIEQEDWAGVRELARRELRTRQRVLDPMRRALPELSAHARTLAELEPLAKGLAFGSPVRRDRQAAVRTELGRAGLSRREAQDAIARMKKSSLQSAVGAGAGSVRGNLRLLDAIAARHQQCRTGALLAAAVANLNLAPRRRIKDPGPQTRNALEAAWKALADSLRDGHPAASLVCAAMLGQTGRDELERCVAYAGVLPGTPSGEDAVKAALATGEAIRSCLLALAAAERLRWVLVCAHAHDRDRWLAPPDAPAFVKTRGAERSSRWNDGDQVVVEGVLSAVTIEHRGRKAISSATVTRDRGGDVRIVLPYIKLDSGGAAAGTAVRVAGTWRDPSAEVAGPALQIDTVSRRDEAKRSLEGWATYLLRGIYQPVPHGLALSASWQRGVDGPANPIRYGTWFDREVANA